jgi:hypothetical protein
MRKRHRNIHYTNVNFYDIVDIEGNSKIKMLHLTLHPRVNSSSSERHGRVDNTDSSYSGGPGFKYRLGDRLS